MGFSDRENKRSKSSVVSNIAGLNESGKGRPKENRETKKRYSIAALPSVHSQISKVAYVERKSVSEITEKLWEDYVRKNKDKLKEYEELNA